MPTETATIVVANLETAERYFDLFEIECWNSARTVLFAGPLQVGGVWDPASGRWKQKELLYFYGTVKGTVYSFRARVLPKGGGPASAWSAWADETAGDTVAPATSYSPSGFATTGGILVKSNPSSIPSDHDRFEFYWSLVNSVPTSGTAANYVDNTSQGNITLSVSPTDTVYIWIRDIDTSGNRQAWQSLGGFNSSGIQTEGLLAADLPYNGDFELFPDGGQAATGWTKDFETSGSGFSYSRSSSPYRGSYAQAIANNGAAAGASIASRPFGVKPGLKYTFRCRASSTVANPTTMYFRILWYSNDDDLSRNSLSLINYTDIVAAGGPTAAGVYQFFSGEVLAPANAKFCRIALYNWINVNCTLTFDTVTAFLSTVDMDAVSDGTTYFRTTANQRDGGGRGFSALDASNILVAGGADFARAYTNKNLDNVPNGTRAAWDSTSQKGAAVDSIGNLKLKNVASAAGSTTTPATTSTSFVDLEEMTITITTNGNKILVLFVGYFFNGTGADSEVRLRCVRDGSQVGITVANDWINTAGFIGFQTMTLVVLDQPASGSHTYKIQWASGYGNQIKNDTTQRFMQVTELG